MTRYVLLLALTAATSLFPAKAQAQTRASWILFTDKPAAPAAALVSEQALNNRRMLGLPEVQVTDIPVSSDYLEALRAHGIKPEAASKWLNAAFATLTPGQEKAVQQLPFVKGLVPAAGQLMPLGNPQKKDAPEYALALQQVKAAAFAKASLTGEGITIGVVDAGYYGASNTKDLLHLFDQKRILGVLDLVDSTKTDHFTTQQTPLDFHGTVVLVNIAGLQASKKQQSGLATNSSFYLSRTDHGIKEWRGEEHYYVRALEWLDSLGVRLVNTSLGYATGFDNPEENYKPADMDGKTSIITRAVQTAATEKGMMIVVAAGNEGEKSNWQIISAPADAEGALSVGAVEPVSWKKVGYSGRGPDALPYLKPDVACFSLTGTSFSAPVITGFAACLLQQKPDLKYQEMFDIIRKSGHLYPYGNNLVGYGVPQAPVALELLKNPGHKPTARLVEAKGNTYTYKVANRNQIAGNGGVLLYHKQSNHLVLADEKGTLAKKGTITVERRHQAERTTLQAGLEVVEIVWK